MKNIDPRLIHAAKIIRFEIEGSVNSHDVNETRRLITGVKEALFPFSVDAPDTNGRVCDRIVSACDELLRVMSAKLVTKQVKNDAYHHYEHLIDVTGKAIEELYPLMTKNEL